MDPRPPEKMRSGAQLFEQQLRSPLGDGSVVTAQDEDHVSVSELMIQLMVGPEFLDEPAYPLVHRAVAAMFQPTSASNPTLPENQQTARRP